MKRRSATFSVLRIVLIYFAVGALWILFSDRLVFELVTDPKAIEALSLAKGWFYILVTSVLLFVLVFDELRRSTILEGKLREGIIEKDTLLAELNHRVKNNLQVISSILNLEAECLSSGEARSVNDRTRARIRSMGIAYERLFEGSDLAHLDLSGYLRDLWEMLIDTYEAGRARAFFELESIVVGADEAVPFGLFATEAISNAILYGASREGRSEVSIRLRATGSDIELQVSDKGPGLPPGAEGLGLRLMDALGIQLKGRVERANEGGALVRLRFVKSGADRE